MIESYDSAGIHIEGTAINLHNQQQSLDAIATEIRKGRSFAFHTLNLDHCVKLRRSKPFRDSYSSARFVTADGAPVALLARILGSTTIRRVTGADLVEPLCDMSAREGFRVFLFGTTQPVLDVAAAELRARHPGLQIVGMLSPSRAFTPDSPEAEEALAAIRASGADLCLVALGAPKQELFAARATTEVEGCGFVCIGAALDFIAGAQVRAPEIFRRAGVEWAWRLATNPVRMGRRYFDCASLLSIYLVQAVARRAQKRTYVGRLPTQPAR